VLQYGERKDHTPGSNSVVYLDRPFTGKLQESITVEAKSISQIMSEVGGKIDFLKIDCEGGEYNILYSLSNSNLKKILIKNQSLMD